MKKYNSRTESFTDEELFILDTCLNQCNSELILYGLFSKDELSAFCKLRSEFTIANTIRNTKKDKGNNYEI